MNDAPKPSAGIRTDLPAVEHATLRCTCAACISARQAEVRRRLEEQRRERARDVAAATQELRPVLFGLRRAQPGTQRAIAKRYGKVAS